MLRDKLNIYQSDASYIDELSNRKCCGKILRVYVHQWRIQDFRKGGAENKIIRDLWVGAQFLFRFFFFFFFFFLLFH